MKNPVFLFKEFLKIVGVLAIAIPVAVLFAAWQEPSVSPTGGNVDAPLNVGATGQGKSGGLILNTGGAANGLIVDKGNVGIGTTDPDYKLSFGPDQGGVSNILALSDEADPNLAMRGIGLLTGGGQYGIGFWADLGAAAPTTGNSRMYISANDGNVGIGTASPHYKLSLGTDTPGVKLALFDDGYSVMGFGIAGNDLEIGTYGTAHDIEFGHYSNNGTFVPLHVMMGSGNVGIGTTNPGYKLDVQAGQINSSGGLCIAGDCKTAWSQVGGGGVSQITAGTNITITPTGGTGNVTINSSGGGGGGVPSGAISFFNLSSCPSGWSAVPSAVGRYLVGGGTLTLTVGTPLGNGENRPTGYHFHFVSSSETGDGGGSGSFVANNPGSSGGRTSSAPYDNSGPFFLTAGTNAPYIQFLVCQKG
ncbi:MAG: hypothetical protein A3H02_01835 [Candidatus Niyogibacteria bacterium RIFCSPLOWO2_12_FULL_41_13]|uniref:Uncharacterized protein n=1 Tax=Candidatus Niyogibacteria bacterium RIFCSPLOWO2_12_FULL_41_13 TaxID=1801726 RepID=A0A1G2F3F3_9BACT|nr:MAG: hypothetical protein A3H02_01835 [Candidatus Niyogibacteria bacterium RIFCSPLOWO2_12_FULL_41_13]